MVKTYIEEKIKTVGHKWHKQQINESLNCMNNGVIISILGLKKPKQSYNSLKILKSIYLYECINYLPYYN